MHIGPYLRKGIVYVPTSRQIPGSYARDTEPVQVAPVSDMTAVMEAIERAINSGNPPITEEEAVALPSWVTPSRTGVKSWSAFEKEMLSWALGTDPKTGEYRMWAYEPFKGGGWVPSRMPVFTLPADTPLPELIRCAAEVICEAAKLQSLP